MSLLIDGPADADVTVMLAHGAGLGMDAPFMARMAEGMTHAGVRVVRFEFPYMARRRAEGIKAPPDRMPNLLDAYRGAIAAANPAGKLVLSGKSMGGRVSTMLAEEAGAAGVIVFGYPFHPPGKPENLRTEHLETLNVPTLICQGERDPFGTREEAPGFPLSKAIRFHWLPDGDHDFKPRKKSGHTHEENLAGAITAANEFLMKLA